MNAAIIFLASAIGLTGCTTIGHYPHGDRGDSGFPPSYPEGRSEYRPPATKDFPVLDAREATETRKVEVALRELEHKLGMKISYIVGFTANKPDTWSYVTSNGAIKSQAELDKTCGKNESPPPVGSDPKCWCKWSGGDGDGVNEDWHIHCRVLPHRPHHR